MEPPFFLLLLSVGFVCFPLFQRKNMKNIKYVYSFKLYYNMLQAIQADFKLYI